MVQNGKFSEIKLIGFGNQTYIERMVVGDSPKSRLHHSQKTYHAKIQGGVIDFEGSEAQGTPCNGALGAPEVPGEVLAEWYCESLK